MQFVLQAGAAFLMIDVGTPYDRTEYILSDSAPVAIITNKEFGSRLHKNVPASQSIPLEDFSASRAPNADVDVSSVIVEGSRLAYVFYTSGTTGNLFIKHPCFNLFSHVFSLIVLSLKTHLQLIATVWKIERRNHTSERDI